MPMKKRNRAVGIAQKVAMALRLMARPETYAGRSFRPIPQCLSNTGDEQRTAPQYWPGRRSSAPSPCWTAASLHTRSDQVDDGLHYAAMYHWRKRSGHPYDDGLTRREQLARPCEAVS